MSILERAVRRPGRGLAYRGLGDGGQSLRALCVESLEDLRSDLQELSAIAGSVREQLEESARELKRCRWVHPAPRREVHDGLKAHGERYDRQLFELEGLVDATRGPATPELVSALTAARRRHAELLRVRQAVSASLVVATDWHSPSIAHVVCSGAGRRTGQVGRHSDDYKRDRHPDAGEFEAAWLADCVDNPHGRPLRALLTGSGMAAFTTILGHLTADVAPGGTILVGASSYHECRELLERGPLSAGLRLVSESDTDGWVSAMSADPPAVVLLDSLCNARGLLVPDLPRIIAAAVACQRPPLLVLDNTGRSVTFQPFPLVPPGSRLRLVVFESLTKYAQFGFDRTAAGIVVADEPVARHLDRHREHLGTNITDVAAHMLPRPHRRLLESRLLRIGRNAELLATRLAGRTAVGDVAVTHPSLTGHPSYGVARRLPFRGGLLSLDLRPDRDDHETRERLLQAILYEARRRRVPICEGTSFGFDTTRVYLTAADTDHGAAFLRVAAGTEHRLDAERLAAALAAALDHLR